MLKSKGMCQPLILATAVGMGFAFVWLVFCSWIMTSFSAPHRWESVAFKNDGTPILRGSFGFRDLAGNAIEVDQKNVLEYGVFLQANDLQPLHTPPASWQQRLRGYTDTRSPPVYWYFLCDGVPRGSAYLVGYHSETYALVGYIGKAGFRDSAPPPEDRFPFDGSGALGDYRAGIAYHVHSAQNSAYGGNSHPFIIARAPPADEFAPWMLFIQGTDDKLYQIDLQGRTANVVLEAKQLQATAWASPMDAALGNFKRFTVRTEDAVLLLNNRLEATERFPLPAELRGKSIWWYPIRADMAAAYTISINPVQDKSEYELYWLDRTGRVTRREYIALTRRTGVPPWPAAVVTMPSSVLLSGCFGLIAALDINGTASPAGAELQAEVMVNLWPALVLTLLLGAVLAGFCYRREMRYTSSLRYRILWTLFVFAFGLPGWIGYRYSRSWPSLATCPTCNAKVPDDRNACAACDAEFPAPAPKGTELFA